MSDWLPDPNRPQVVLGRKDLIAMIRLARLLRRLSKTPCYLEALDSTAPMAARFDPGNESVMMGYDFHLTPQGPRLIEVNTNAGGSLMAYRALQPCFPPGPRFPAEIYDANDHRQRRLLNSFAEEFSLCNHSNGLRQPKRIAILDEAPKQQFLYPEMRAFATLFEQWGSETIIVDPKELEMTPHGIFHQNQRIDLIYNRHCDFYLESKALDNLSLAWRNQQVCLTPNPRIYWLLADKRRMIQWSDPIFLHTMGLDTPAKELIGALVPKTLLFTTLEKTLLWTQRNQWVFKPFSGFGSRGVLLGSKISRARFNELDPEATLVQQYIPPSKTLLNPTEPAMKTDFRLFFYRDLPLGVAARVYQGQVTNFQIAGNGFRPVKIMPV